jgi:hypothetical protein
MSGSNRPRRGTRLTLAGFLLSLLISAHRGEQVDGQEIAGHIGAEIVITELFGNFRNVVRFIFMVATAE